MIINLKIVRVNNENNYSLVDLKKETLTIAELKYQKLLREQLDWLNAKYKIYKILKG